MRGFSPKPRQSKHSPTRVNSLQMLSSMSASCQQTTFSRGWRKSVMPKTLMFHNSCSDVNDPHLLVPHIWTTTHFVSLGARFDNQPFCTNSLTCPQKPKAMVCCFARNSFDSQEPTSLLTMRHSSIHSSLGVASSQIRGEQALGNIETHLS